MDDAKASAKQGSWQPYPSVVKANTVFTHGRLAYALLTTTPARTARLHLVALVSLANPRPIPEKKNRWNGVPLQSHGHDFNLVLLNIHRPSVMSVCTVQPVLSALEHELDSMTSKLRTNGATQC